MSEKVEDATQPDVSNISKQIVRNTVELQGIHFLQGKFDSLRDERLSNMMLKNNIMMKWLQNPSDTHYKEIITSIGINSLRDDVKDSYRYALDMVSQKK
ncbi:hypothetical protein ACJJIW_14920 [Microbulbifer sp. JMSA004]|uniref:hypothetical protein n=1 Tax=unclassified Microbulbifer TaxID=2619833 RepID=UPI0024AC9D61|nr:hypothetical protein [Microbulbifer sp. VAAF005]WHI47705.1 hypothetical protein P0078_04750 [Microbulbifer sp. VAAF005]